jgi:predicted permease
MAILTCVVGLGGNVVGMLAASTLRSVPVGTPIRPMGLAAFLFLVALTTAGIGITVAVIAIANGRRRRLVWAVAALGIVLSLMPLFTSRLVWDHIVAQRGLIEEP